MYNYGPGQSNPGGQLPDNSANSPYSSPQPQYPQDPYQQQQPADPNAYPQQPPVSPTQPYDPSQAMTSGVPSSPAPQFGGAAAVPAPPTAPVTGPGPLDPTMTGAPMGGPNPMLPVPAPKKSPAVPILAGVSALFLVGTVIFMVLFFSANSDLADARSTISDNEESIDKQDEEIKDLKDDKEAAEEIADKSAECVTLVEDLFDELYGGADTDEIDRLLDEMESTCQSS